MGRTLSIIGEGHPLHGFASHKDAALALLNKGGRLTRKAGSFLGQCVVDPTPLTEAQTSWITTLLERAELPLLDGGANG